MPHPLPLAMAPLAPSPGLGAPHLLKSRSLEGVPGSPGECQKEGQEDQGTVTQLPGSSLALYLSLVFLAFLLALPWGSWASLQESTSRR